MTLTIPQPSNNMSAVDAIILECCSMTCSISDVVLKTIRGVSFGTARINVNMALPATMPMAKAITIAYL